MRFCGLFCVRDRDIQAMAEQLLLDLKQHGVRPLSVEGMQQAEWCLIDLGDIIVHLFNAEKREYYGLEKLWQDGQVVFPN